MKKGYVALSASFDDGSPSQGIHGIEHHPHAQDEHEPMPCMSDLLPQLHETHLEGENHDDDSHQTNKKENVSYFITHPLPFNDSLFT
jgi:hypothetical protein